MPPHQISLKKVAEEAGLAESTVSCILKTTVGVMLPMAGEFFCRILLGVHNGLVAKDHVPIVLWSYVDPILVKVYQSSHI